MKLTSKIVCSKKEEPKEFKPGLLYTYNNRVVMCTGPGYKDCLFSGFTIMDNSKYPERLGYESNSWAKEVFEPFVGSILLEQS